MSDAVTVTGSVHNYPAIPECDLGSHLGNILESGSYSDVTLAVGDKEFKAHKAILAGKGHTIHVPIRLFPYHTSSLALLLPVVQCCMLKAFSACNLGVVR